MTEFKIGPGLLGVARGCDNEDDFDKVVRYSQMFFFTSAEFDENDDYDDNKDDEDFEKVGRCRQMFGQVHVSQF